MMAQVQDDLPGRAQQTLAQEGREGLRDLLHRHESMEVRSFDAYRRLIQLYIEFGFDADARRCLDRISGLLQRPGLAMLRTLLAPKIPQDRAEIDAAWDVALRGLDRIRESGATVNRPIPEIGRTLHFRFSYHGCSVREFNQKVARTFEAVVPGLRWVAPDGHSRKGHRRLGVLFNWGSASAMGRAFQTTFLRLQAHGMEPIGIFVAGNRPGELPGISRWVRIPEHIGRARKILADLELDWLIFTEIGMEIVPYLLAFSRFAPMQVAMGGHPATSGCPEIDAFLVPAEGAHAESDQFFTEEFVRIPGMIFPAQDKMPDVRGSPSILPRLGIPPHAKVYYVPNHPQKIIPEFDRIVATVLDSDPSARVVFARPHMAERAGFFEPFLQRLKGTLGDRMARVTWHDMLALPEFAHLCTEVDVVMDTPGFGMGTTTYYPHWYGTPVIGYDGKSIAERGTVALLRRFGLDELIAQSHDDIGRLALWVANDRRERDRVSARLIARREAVFEHETFSEALARYIAQR